MLTMLLRTGRPSFYEARFADERPRLCRACAHLALVCAMLSLPTSLLFLAQLAPALSEFDAPALLDEAVRVFPLGLELALNGSRLTLIPSDAAFVDSDAPDDVRQPARTVCLEEGGTLWCAQSGPHAPLTLTLGWRLYSLFYSELPHPLYAPPSRLLLALGLGDDLWDDDPYPRAYDHAVGDEVLVRGGFGALFWDHGWTRATVVSARPAVDPAHYEYELEIGGDHIRRPADEVPPHRIGAAQHGLWGAMVMAGRDDNQARCGAGAHGHAARGAAQHFRRGHAHPPAWWRNGAAARNRCTLAVGGAHSAGVLVACRPVPHPTPGAMPRVPLRVFFAPSPRLLPRRRRSTRRCARRHSHRSSHTSRSPSSSPSSATSPATTPSSCAHAPPPLPPSPRRGARRSAG